MKYKFYKKNKESYVTYDINSLMIIIGVLLFANMFYKVRK